MKTLTYTDRKSVTLSLSSTPVENVKTTIFWAFQGNICRIGAVVARSKRSCKVIFRTNLENRFLQEKKKVRSK